MNQERGGASFAPQRRSPKGAVGPKPIDGSLVEINHGAACLDFASGPWKTGFLDANVSVTCRSKSHVHACMHACTADIPDSSRKSGLPGANGTAVPDRLRLRSCSRESAPSCSTGAVLGGAPSGEGAPSESERTSLPDLVGRWCDRPQRWDHRWDRFHPKEGSWYHLWDERWSISQGKGHVMGVVS